MTASTRCMIGAILSLASFWVSAFMAYKVCCFGFGVAAAILLFSFIGFMIMAVDEDN